MTTLEDWNRCRLCHDEMKAKLNKMTVLAVSGWFMFMLAVFLAVAFG